MEKDEAELPKKTQIKICRYILRSITKLMINHFFKSDEFQRPKNIANLLMKATDYLKLWYSFLQRIFLKNDIKNSSPPNNIREEFNDFDIPEYLLRRKKKIHLKKIESTNVSYDSQGFLASPRSNKANEYSFITFSDQVEKDEIDETANDLDNLTKFQKKFYCKEYIHYFLKINICWCQYYHKFLFLFEIYIIFLFRKKDINNYVAYLYECEKFMNKFSIYEVYNN